MFQQTVCSRGNCGMWAGRAACCAAIALLFWCRPGLRAQDTNADANAVLPALPTAMPLSGLQLRSMSAYAVYYSNGVPVNAGFQSAAANATADVGLGGSAVIAWTKFTDRSSFALTYTPSYTARVRYSSLDAFNNNLALTVSRKLAPRWNLGFSITGDLSSIDQSLFNATSLGNVTSVPSSFEDLAAGLLASKFSSNPLLGSVLNTAPLVESPVRNLLYGERMLTTAGRVSLSYSYSPRLSITFTGGASRAQHVSDEQPVTAQNNFLVLDSTSGQAGMSISYSLSPLTQIGGSVTTVRVASSIADVDTTTSSVSIGRTVARRWILMAHGGVGVAKSIRQTTYQFSSTPKPAVGGSIGFKTFANTLLASFDRSVSDSYGLGASTSSSAGFSWRWSRPGRSWWLTSNFGWQRLETGNSGSAASFLQNTSGWQVTSGLGRNLNRHLTLLLEYAYLNYSGGFQKTAYSLSQNAVRVSLAWTPHPDIPR